MGPPKRTKRPIVLLGAVLLLGLLARLQLEAACTLAVLSLVFTATVLFWGRAGRWPVLRVLHRRGRVTRAAWLASVLVGLWLGLSVDTARRVWRLNPGAQRWRE